MPKTDQKNLSATVCHFKQIANRLYVERFRISRACWENRAGWFSMAKSVLLLHILLATVFAGNGSKAVVIGIAQDGGIPQIGCTQKICRTQKHSVSSIALIDQNSTFLIDATPDLREQYSELTKRYPKAARPNLFDGILLTHAHMGHYMGLLYLGKESISTKEVPVWCSAEMAEYLSKNHPWSLLITNRNIKLHPYESGKPIQLGSFKVTPIAVPHRREFTDTHGFIIEGSDNSLLYIPDIDSWDPVKKEMSEWLSNHTYALLDGSFYSGKELPGRDMRLIPHPTIETSIAFLNGLAPFQAKVFFTHLNHTNPLLDSNSVESAVLAKTPFRIAQEWQEFNL